MKRNGMEVLVPRHSGFCPGVRQAEKSLLSTHDRETETPLRVYGYLINNKQYISMLSSKGILTVADWKEINKGSIAVIRTHGIRREEEKKIRQSHRVLDLTCRNVKKVQLKIKEHSDKGFYILITGKKTHPEVEGLVSYAEQSFVIETENDLAEFEKKYLMDGSLHQPIFIVSQTTGNRALFETVCKRIEGRVTAQPVVFDSICPVTELKEKEAMELQDLADVSFVIGDKLSSNAAKLYQILKARREEVHFIEDLQDLLNLNLPLINYKIALVVSSASTPFSIEETVCRYLKDIR
ncbi:MAG: 4-hydroxy-3-methylbut-2-enyl diphosphate reductase [Spirochaetales bacterium]|nr:4-hydroxy-3-methylbut-2-enyl diphosphate reductase [Spirochaetales bacterium]